MKTTKISAQEVRIIRVLRNKCGEYVSSKEVAEAADVSSRTARALLLELAKSGVVEQVEVFPGNRYLLTEQAFVRWQDYFHRIDQAEAIFGQEMREPEGQRVPRELREPGHQRAPRA